MLTVDIVAANLVGQTVILEVRLAHPRITSFWLIITTTFYISIDGIEYTSRSTDVLLGRLSSEVRQGALVGVRVCFGQVFQRKLDTGWVSCRSPHTLLAIATTRP